MKGGTVKKGLLILLMLVSYLLCIVSYKNLRGIQDTVTILCSQETEETMDESAYKNITEQEDQKEMPASFAMWQESDGGVIEVPDFGRSAETTVLKIRGKMSVLFGDFAPLAEDDMDGCCLDEQAALKLFGSRDIYGSQLRYKDKIYTVRGVLRDYGGLFVMRPGRDETIDRVTLQTPEDMSPASYSREFTAQYAITGAVLNNSMLKETVQIFPILLPLCIGIWILFSIRAVIKKEACGRSERIFCYGLFLLTVIILLSALVKFIQIPRDMIPTKWSDFQFWSNWYDNFSEQISVYIRYPKGKTEMTSVWLFTRCAAFGLLSVILYMCVGLSGKKPRRVF